MDWKVHPDPVQFLPQQMKHMMGSQKLGGVSAQLVFIGSRATNYVHVLIFGQPF